MSKANALSGLIGNYGDSDEESDDGGSRGVAISSRNGRPAVMTQGFANVPANSHLGPEVSAAIHPAPIPHCPWSACYDENSGFTYYWNQQTNAVTWEAPPEYLLALKLAQQQLHTSGSTEVSAEEWQLYQQALAEKQNTPAQVVVKPTTTQHSKAPVTGKKMGNKRRISDEDEKIELITSYHNSDSESNDESESPVKVPITVKPPKLPKTQPRKPKPTKPKEFGPALPPNQHYTVPIGPEIPKEFLIETPKDEKQLDPLPIPEEPIKPDPPENQDSQDEILLLTKLKNKAKLLEKLGGEIPVELQKIIQDETSSKPNSPKETEANKDSSKSSIDTNIDELLQEIEQKELPKVVRKNKIDMFSSDGAKSSEGSLHNSPRSNDASTPPREEIKPLFPSSKNIADIPTSSLFPSAVNIEENNDKEAKESLVVAEKKGANLYLTDPSEIPEKAGRKKLRISNSVLPVKKPELPSYTTKYAQSIDGLSSERTGLGFTKEDEEEVAPKNTISYGNGLMFTKGETLNEDKKDEDLDDLTELLEAKLKYLSQLQPSVISPVQEMTIQMQTLVAAFRFGALSRSYWRRWALGAGAALRRHEAAAAPPGWTCVFQRSEGRYRYERECDGLVQWEYPAAANMDMDICTTPPHPGIEHKVAQAAADLHTSPQWARFRQHRLIAEEEVPPPLPPAPPAAPPPPPLPPPRPRTPPPPSWADPPPPGCDDLTPPIPPEPKQDVSDELTSFYNDIAELEKAAPISAPSSLTSSPEPKVPEAPKLPEPPKLPELPPTPTDREKTKEREKEKEKDGAKMKKKSKVKISSSMGMKHKSVSSLVAKWQQVAEEINSD